MIDTQDIYTPLIPDLAKGGSAGDYAVVEGYDLTERVAGFGKWYDARLAHGLWPYNKTLEAAPGTTTSAIEEDGRKIEGINLASQDYLSLAKHPKVVRAAIEACERYGVHSAGSTILMGNTRSSRELEQLIGETLGYRNALLFPTGWAAGFGVLRGLVRPHDHVVIDALAHSCLQEGARFTTKNVHLSLHLSLSHVERHLQRIRREDKRNAIFVVSEGLFSMDSDTPDLPALQVLCRTYEAVLILDIAHDFGVLGKTGRSALEEAGMLGEVDIVMGAFSKTFASNGGFVLVRDCNSLKYLRVYSTSQLFSNALSPIQTTVIQASMRVSLSDEGGKRRRSLFRNAVLLRKALSDGGLSCLGRASPIIPVEVGSEFEVRLAHRLSGATGVLVNMAEYPVVPRGKARFRLQVQSAHTKTQITTAAARILDAVNQAKHHCRQLETTNNGGDHV